MQSLITLLKNNLIRQSKRRNTIVDQIVNNVFLIGKDVHWLQLETVSKDTLLYLLDKSRRKHGYKVVDLFFVLYLVNCAEHVLSDIVLQTIVQMHVVHDVVCLVYLLFLLVFVGL